MTRVVLDGLLVLIVAASWLAAWGLARLRSPLDRLHAASFANATFAILLPLFAFLGDGPSTRAFKTLLVGLLLLGGGAVASHAVGRAILLRDEADRRPRGARAVTASR